MKVKRSTLLLFACLIWSAIRISISPHWFDSLSRTCVCVERLVVRIGFWCFPKICFWKTGAEAYRQNPFLSGGAPLFSEIF